MTRTLLIGGLMMASGFIVAMPAQAALQGRDLDGNHSTYEAYYDTDLNITWLADMNYASTSRYDGDGRMTWEAASTWANSLSFFNPLTNQTYDDWRLPKTFDTSNPGCDLSYSGTDCGYNVDPASSEMANLWYVTLNNKAYYDSTGGGPQANWGLRNAGPFTNFQSNFYWSDTEYALYSTHAWQFRIYDGGQGEIEKTNSLYAMAVTDGDVAAVPEAETYVLMLAGLGLVGWAARRRIAK